MQQANADAEALTHWTLAFAEKMLLKKGEFYPFAAVVNNKGEVEAIAVDDGESDHPLSQHIIDLNRRMLRLGAQSGKWRATALAYDVLTSAGPGMQKSDAVAFEIDHREGFSKILTLPYRLTSGHIAYGEMKASEGNGEMYTSH